MSHTAAGDRAAVIHSLIVSTKRRRLDLHAYMKDVITRLPAITSNDDLNQLLPTKRIVALVVTILPRGALGATVAGN